MTFGSKDSTDNKPGNAVVEVPRVRSGRKLKLGRSRSHDAVIRVYDDAGNLIETHEHKGDFKEW